MILLNEVEDIEFFATAGFGAIKTFAKLIEDNLFDIENAFMSAEQYLDIVGYEHNRCLLFATEIFSKAVEMEKNLHRICAKD